MNTTSMPGTNYWEYYVHMYYIKDSADGVPGLYRKKLSYKGGTAEVIDEGEIVSGIRDFAIQFAVDSVSGDHIPRAHGYKTSLTTGEAIQSITARVSVLAHSLNQDFSTKNNRKYSLYPGEITYPANYSDLTNSHYYGRSFTTAVGIRNNAYRMSDLLLRWVGAPG